MMQRKPLSRHFHPAGLLVIPLVGIAAALFDTRLMGRPFAAYAAAAAAVVPLHLLQLVLDYRHGGTWYRLITSPPYRLNWKQLLRLRWPSLLIALLMPFLGAIPVASLFLACLVLYYPWQRSLYLRSQREFGPQVQKVSTVAASGQ